MGEIQQSLHMQYPFNCHVPSIAEHTDQTVVQKKLVRTCGAEPLPVQEYNITPTDPVQSKKE